jgi:Flp pilus assembly CpaE family ATPase
MVVALASVKGAPGVTTAAVGLAARWPQAGAVVIEADPAGGDLAARFGLHPEPGLATAALDSRRTAAETSPEAWTQLLSCGVEVVFAPPGAAAAASLTELGDRAPRVLAAIAAQHPAVFVDVGRWHPGSPSERLLAVADLVLLVACPTVEEIRQLQTRLAALHAVHTDVHLLLTGDGAWPAAEVGTALGLPVAAALPLDGSGAGVLTGRMVPRRGWRSAGWTRLPLLRACRSLALTLDGMWSASNATADAPVVVRS